MNPTNKDTAVVPNDLFSAESLSGVTECVWDPLSTGGFKVCPSPRRVQRNWCALHDIRVDRLKPVLWVEKQSDTRLELYLPCPSTGLKALGEPPILETIGTPEHGARFVRGDGSVVGTMMRKKRFLSPKSHYSVFNNHDALRFSFDIFSGGPLYTPHTDIYGSEDQMDPVGFFIPLFRSPDRDTMLRNETVFVASLPKETSIEDNLLLLGISAVFAQENVDRIASIENKKKAIRRALLHLR